MLKRHRLSDIKKKGSSRRRKWGGSFCRWDGLSPLGKKGFLKGGGSKRHNLSGKRVGVGGVRTGNEKKGQHGY